MAIGFRRTRRHPRRRPGQRERAGSARKTGLSLHAVAHGRRATHGFLRPRRGRGEFRPGADLAARL